MEEKWIWLLSIIVALVVVAVVVFFKKNKDSQLVDIPLIEENDDEEQPEIAPKPAVEDAVKDDESSQIYDDLFEKYFDLYGLIIGAVKEQDDKLMIDKIKEEVEKRDLLEEFMDAVKEARALSDIKGDRKNFIEEGYDEIVELYTDIMQDRGNATRVRQKAVDIAAKLGEIGYAVYFYDEVKDTDKRTDFKLGSSNKHALPALYKHLANGEEELLRKGRN